jgi:hypothetical protein
MAPETLIHPETGDVYIKPFDWQNTPIWDIALSTLLATLLGALIFMHAEALVFNAPSPLFFPHWQFAQYLLQKGVGIFQTPFPGAIFPMYGYIVAGIVAIAGPSFDQAAPGLFLTLSVAYMTTAILFYLMLRRGFSRPLSFGLSLLVFAAPAGLTSLLALTPLPLFWLGIMLLFYCLNGLRASDAALPTMAGGLIVVFLVALHPMGMAVGLGWFIALLSLGRVAPAMMTLLAAVLVLVTLPGLNVATALFPLQAAQAPSAVNALGASSVLAESGTRVIGLFESLYQWGSSLLLQPDANLVHWPLGESQRHWWPRLLSQVYQFFTALPWLAWPLGAFSALLVLWKSVHALIAQREATPLIFLTWALVGYLVLAIAMPHLFLAGQKTALFLLPLSFLFLTFMAFELNHWAVARPVIMPLNTLVVGTSTLLLVFFQLQVGYAALGKWYSRTPSAQETTLAFPVQPGLSPLRVTPSGQGYAYSAVASPASDRGSTAQGIIPASLYGWLNRSIPFGQCLMSFHPDVDAATLRRQVYRVPEVHSLSRNMAVQPALICPYFVEHKAIASDYDWVLALNQGQAVARPVYDDGKPNGWRIWKVASIQ